MKPRASKTSAPRAGNVTPITELHLAIHASAGRTHLPFLRKHLRAAHQLLSTPLAELSLALVGDARMSSLHKKFMNIDGPTDVLTFPLEFDCDGRETAGEIVICVPEAARQGRRRGTTVACELLLYALHGMLHLSGFDDRTEAGFRQMHRKEDDILTHLGIGPIFETEGSAGRRNPHVSSARIANRSSGQRTRTGETIRRRNRAFKSVGV